MMGGDFLRKRIVKVKISQEQMTLLRLKSAITDLSDESGDSTKKPYKVTVRKIPPVETDLVTVGKINNTIKFEVREKESHHNEAHFHITIRGQGSGSYRISDFTAIESNIPRKVEKQLLEWAQENRQTLIDTWNEFHGYRITVA